MASCSADVTVALSFRSSTLRSFLISLRRVDVTVGFGVENVLLALFVVENLQNTCLLRTNVG